MQELGVPISESYRTRANVGYESWVHPIAAVWYYPTML